MSSLSECCAYIELARRPPRIKNLVVNIFAIVKRILLCSHKHATSISSLYELSFRPSQTFGARSHALVLGCLVHDAGPSRLVHWHFRTRRCGDRCLAWSPDDHLTSKHTCGSSSWRSSSFYHDSGRSCLIDAGTLCLAYSELDEEVLAGALPGCFYR